MGIPVTTDFDGRDASQLFTGDGPDDWSDVAFIRGTQNWFCALTDRYKLVYATNERPWLFDLQVDPEERINFFEHPDYQQTVRQLTRQLDGYSRAHRDPYRDAQGIKQAMDAVL